MESNRDDRANDPAVPRWLGASVAVGWRVALLGILIIGAGMVLSQLWIVVIPLVIGLGVAAVLGPPARYLERRGLPPLAAAWLVFLAAGTVVGAAGWLFGPRIVAEMSALPDALDDAIDEGRSWLVDGPFDISERDLDRWIADAEDAANDNRSTLVNGAFRYAVGALQLVAGAVMTVVIAFFFVKDGPRMVDWLIEQVPADRRATAAGMGARAWATLTGFIRGSALNGLVEACITAVGLLLLGVPLVVPLAVLTFLGGFLPLVGALLAGVLATAVALAANGPVTAAAVAILFVAVQNIEGDVLQPLIMGKAIKLHPVVVLVSITAGGVLLGLPGALLAVPVVATAVNVVGYLREQDADAATSP